MSFYDNFYQRDKITRVGKYMVKSHNRYLIKLILKYASKNSRNLKVLEIGPGVGYFAAECKKYGLSYTAIEQNVEMCKRLKKIGFEIYNRSVPPLRIKTKYDVIIMNHVIEHMSGYKEAVSLFRGCTDGLSSGGLLITLAPDIKYFKEDFFVSDYTHGFPISLYSLRQLYFDFDYKIKYSGVYSFLLMRGHVFAFLNRKIVGSLYYMGLLDFVFRDKAYKIKNLSNASCIVVGKHD